MPPSLRRLLLHAFALAAVVSTSQAAHYTITDLGTLSGGGTLSQALGINNLGQVVGLSTTNADNDDWHAFVYTPGSGMQDLGTLGGSTSAAYSINDLGQIVGYAFLTGSWRYDTPGARANGFLWSESTGMQNIGTHGSTYSIATDINNTGQAVVLTSHERSYYLDQTYSFTVNTNTLALATGPISRTFSTGLNDAGQIAGYTYPGDAARGFSYTPGEGMDVFGAVGDGVWYGTRRIINNVGQVAVVDKIHGADGSVIAMGSIDGYTPFAKGINDRGEVVGGKIKGNYSDEAFYFSEATGLLDLQDLIPTDSGWLLMNATAINNVGQIVGSGMLNGEQHAFVLTPYETAPVPDLPSTAVLLLASLLTLFRYARIHRYQLKT